MEIHRKARHSPCSISPPPPQRRAYMAHEYRRCRRMRAFLLRGPSSLPPCLLSVSFLVPSVCIPLFCLFPSESSAPSYLSLEGGREGEREGGERDGWRKGRNDREWEGWRFDWRREMEFKRTRGRVVRRDGDRERI